MDELGWLKSGAFREADKREILEHSVMRYHAYAFVYQSTLYVLIDSLPKLSRLDDCVPELHACTYVGYRPGVAYAPDHGKSVRCRLRNVRRSLCGTVSSFSFGMS